MNPFDFGTAVDLGGRTNFGFGGGGGFSPTFAGFGSQPTPTNQGGSFFNNFLTGGFGGGSNGLLTGILGGVNTGLAANAANQTADAAFAAAQGQIGLVADQLQKNRQAQIGTNLFNTAFTFGPGADLNFERADIADQRTRFRNIRDAQIANEIAISPAAMQRRKLESDARIREAVAPGVGALQAQFGGFGPVNISNTIV
jgi:hypothetical protein